MSESDLQDTLDEIRRRYTARDAIKSSATDWKDESNTHRCGRCTHPEHGHTSDDSNAANLIVDGSEDYWYCYSHDAGGDVLKWIAIEEGYTTCDGPMPTGRDFIEVVKAAAERAGVEVDFDSDRSTHEDVKDSTSLTDEMKARYALDKAVDILHERLGKVIGDVTVRGHIKQHRPFDDDLINDLRIGYLDGEGFAELMREFSDDVLKDMGIMREDGSQHGENRIIYPYNPKGLPDFWIGRRTGDSPMDAKYLKPKRDTRELSEPCFEWHSPGTSMHEGLYITEGIQDAVATAEAGGVTAISPVAKDPNPEQKEQILTKAQDVGRAVICFDADEGGRGGAIDLALDIMSAGVQTEMLQLPEDTDPCDYFMDGGDFDDLETRHAAEEIVEVKGESDPVLREILDTAEPGSTRAERLVDRLSDCTPHRKHVLRDLLQERHRVERQQGFRRPDRIIKPAGQDVTWTFVWADGTRIEMDTIAGHGAAPQFADKYGAEFNYFPDWGKSEWLERVNEWQAAEGVEVTDIDPHSPEARTLAHVQEQIQQLRAVEGKEALATAGLDKAAYHEGYLMVHNRIVSDWLDDIDVGVQRAGKYLKEIKGRDTRPARIDGKLHRFWWFDVEAIDENGYSLPDTERVEDDSDDESDMDEEVEEL